MTDDARATQPEDDRRVRELIGVYHANGSLVGELSYWVGARLGRTHCALCDITHGTFREKASWRTCRATLPVPVTTVHLDEQPTDLATLTSGRTPCVVAVSTDGEQLLLLTPDDLERCAGSPERLVDEVQRAVTAQGLRFAD